VPSVIKKRTGSRDTLPEIGYFTVQLRSHKSGQNEEE
jgi:hypothetical protein